MYHLIPPTYSISFSSAPLFFRQDIWPMRQQMRQNGRIFGRSQVYLFQIRERDTHCVATRRKTVRDVHSLMEERKASWLEYLIRRKSRSFLSTGVSWMVPVGRASISY